MTRFNLFFLLIMAFHATLTHAANDLCGKMDPDGGGNGNSQSKQSIDPNEMAGPAGIGTSRYVKNGEWLDYTIYFENKSTASAAAQEIYVTLPKDAGLDWSSLELGEIAFGDNVDTGLDGKSSGESEYTLQGGASSVRTKVTVSATEVKWYLRSWVQGTTDHFPEAAEDGFLPPNNDETHCGEGHLRFRVKVREDATIGSVINASATIVFDMNDPITTDPAWWNTVGDVRTVAFDLGDETATNLTLVAGEKFGELPSPTRSGYAFKGWYFGPNGTQGEVTSETIVPSGLEKIYSDWEAGAIDLWVDGVKRICHSGDKLNLNTFANVTNGYTNVVCVGWIGTGDVPASGTGNKVSFTVTQESSLMWLYATNYWVSVGAACGDAIETIASTCAGGSVAVKDAAGVAITNELWAACGTNLTAEATANEGWLFAGWRDAGTGADCGADGVLALPVTQPWLLEAVFTSKVFAVSFDLGEHGTRLGGGELAQTVEWGKAAVAPTVSAKAGYTFTKWDVAFDNVKSTLKVTAQYSIDTYTIAYVEPMGCENTNPTSYTVEDAITFSALTNPPGWKFFGWSPASIAKGTTGDKAVTAQWEQIKYNVDIGGVVDNTCTNGQIVTAETFAAVTNGYTNIVCVGWIGTGDVPASGTGNKVLFTVTQESSLTWLYATNYWVSVGAACGDAIEAIASTCAGGSVAVKDAADAAITNELWAAAGTNLTAEAMANEGWLFAGWRDADGGRGATALPEGGHAGRVTLPVTQPWLLESVFTSKVFAVTYENTRGCFNANPKAYTVENEIEFVALTNAPGWKFLGWSPAKIERGTMGDLTVTALWERTGVLFKESELTVAEGGHIDLLVSGGSVEKASSAVVYLTYQTAAAADIDLKTAKVDGVTPKGGIKFPLTLNWAAGVVTNHVISIPVKTDKTVEDDETLVFQLAAAQGQELGEITTCAVTIRDANVAADYATKQAKETVKTKKGVETNALAVACVAGDGSGTVCGYTTGQGKYSKGSKASLKATARPGWEFKGWGAVADGVTNIVSEKASWNVTLTNDAEIVALFGRIPYVAGLASPADGGKVAGSGYCAAGKKVTLKATANKNFTFTGWYTNDVLVSSLASLVLDRSAKPAKSDAKQTVITDVSESVTYYATFKSDPTVYVYLTADDGATAPGKVTGAGKYATGKKKIALKATANKGYVFRGWYEGASVDLINDVPLTKSATYTLAEMPTNDVEYTAGFITANLDKSYIAATVDGFDFDATHLSYATNIWTGVYLEWPVAASALSETTVKVAGLPSGLKFTAKDVTQKIGSGKTAQTVVVVPANTIYGAPSAASKTAKDKKTGTVSVTPSTVKITVTTAGKSSQTYQINTTVDPLPAWAQGTFTGPSYGGDETNGFATVTIAASGKISAKQPVNGKSTSFAASYFDSYVADESAFYATLTAKVGKEVVTNELAVSPVEIALTETASVTNGIIEADLFDAWQYNWKSEPWKTLIKPLDKQTSTYYIDETGAMIDEYETAPTLGADGIVGKVTLKFAASGAVTVTGEFVTGFDAKNKAVVYKASGSSTLVPSADGNLVFIYLAPNTAKKFSGHVRCYDL